MNKAQDILARTIWGEARGEGIYGMLHVAWVIRNRVNDGINWNGNSYEEVCLAPQQFSAWNEGDPNREKMLALTLETDADFVHAWDIAGQVIAGEVEDPTDGATHYHTLAVSPYWADSTKVTKIAGNHIFYAGIA